MPLNYKSYGFVGLKKQTKQYCKFAIDKKRKGEVIYMIDNPLFRGFGKTEIYYSAMHYF
jgi:hypothetical protein